jgi:hypothetical protein
MDKKLTHTLDSMTRQFIGMGLDEFVGKAYKIQEMSMKELEDKFVNLTIAEEPNKARLYLMEISSRELKNNTSRWRVMRRLKKLRKRISKATKATI